MQPIEKSRLGRVKMASKNGYPILNLFFIALITSTVLILHISGHYIVTRVAVKDLWGGILGKMGVIYYIFGMGYLRHSGLRTIRGGIC